jgi:hypothetical protein
MTLEIQFPAHNVERLSEGTSHVQKNHAKFSNDCQRLIDWHRANPGKWMSNVMARDLGLSSYASARYYDLKRAGVQIEKKYEQNQKWFKVCMD